MIKPELHIIGSKPCFSEEEKQRKHKEFEALRDSMALTGAELKDFEKAKHQRAKSKVI